MANGDGVSGMMNVPMSLGTCSEIRKVCRADTRDLIKESITSLSDTLMARLNGLSSRVEDLEKWMEEISTDMKKLSGSTEDVKRSVGEVLLAMERRGIPTKRRAGDDDHEEEMRLTPPAFSLQISPRYVKPVLAVVVLTLLLIAGAGGLSLVDKISESRNEVHGGSGHTVRPRSSVQPGEDRFHTHSGSSTTGE